MAVQVEDIASSGDVILVVGQGSNILRLKAHSFILRTASEAFKVMFGPNFVEGKDLSHTNPKEVTLEDDDPEAMRTICQVLHFKECPQSMSAEKIWNIAQAVDKYFLNEALKFPMEVWLSSNFEGFDNYMYNMKTSMLLQHRKAFKTATRSIVLNSTESLFTSLDNETCLDLIKVLVSLDSTRSQLRKQFDQAIHENLTLTTSVPDCNCDKPHIRGLSKIIREKKLQPRHTSNRTVTSCLNDLMQHRPYWALGTMRPSCRSDMNCRHMYPDELWDDLQSLLMKIRNYEGRELEKLT